MTAIALPGRVMSPRARTWLALAAVGVAAAAFLLVGLSGNLGFVLGLRGRKVASMMLVGWATGVATVAFQTITHNRLLTPSILGLDALFAFIQTVLVLVLGVSLSSSLDPGVRFALNVGLMLVCTMGLTGLLFGRRNRSVYVLVLAGLVLGSVLRALSSLATRVMDPTSYLVLQNNLFASFSTVHPELLLICAVVVAGTTTWLWTQRSTLDVIALGRDTAVGLGVSYQRAVRRVLLASALLVCVSTALVGPITFLGLIVAAVAYEVAGSGRHQFTLPMAGLLGVLLLVGGQAILEQVFEQGTLLSVVIEFAGGIVFIALVIGRFRK